MVEELRPGDPRQMGPYRLTGRLGGGGMGDVYLGRSAGGRAVAVKVIRAELAADPEFRARFRQEVEAARMVNGLYTALLADADALGPVPWLATAYVPGPSLASAVEDYGPLPPHSVLALAGGLAEGLGAIHAAGLVHRDVKPSNVLLADDGPRVIDFGISRATAATVLTSAGFVVGSPGFMSPEQATGRPVGPPSDVFSLGGVLTFAASGEGPFGGGATPALLYRIVHGEPDLDRVPGRVRPLVRWCLAKNPDKRPTTSDLLAELGDVQLWDDWLPEEVLAGVPRGARVRTPPPPNVPRPQATQTVETPPGGKPAQAAGRQAAEKATPGAGAPPSAAGRAPAPAAPPAPGSASAADASWFASPRGATPPPDGATPATPATSPERAGRRGRRERPGMSRRTIAALAGLAVLAVTGVALGLALGGHGSTSTHGTNGTTTPSASAPAQVTLANRFAVSGATAYACAPGFSSVGGQRGAQVVFTNASGAAVQVYWLDFSGAKKLYVRLKPGASQRIKTYVGDYWLISDATGGCMGIFGVNGAGHITVDKT